MWINHLASATGVGVSSTNIDRVIKLYFPDGPPDQLPFEFAIVVSTKDSPVEKFGALVRASPCEQAFAVLRAIARDIEKGDVRCLD